MNSRKKNVTYNSLLTCSTGVTDMDGAMAESAMPGSVVLLRECSLFINTRPVANGEWILPAGE